MKYIFSIVGIILLLSCVMWLISPDDSRVIPDKNALSINDRVISFAELEQMWQRKPYHYRDQKEFFDDLVLREVLIQVAIASGIADETEFKRSIQDFFEQSLVKTLLDRKQLEQTIVISKEQMARFREAQRLRYQLTLFRYPSLQQAQDSAASQPQQLTDDFIVLPEALQTRLLTLKPGELSAPFFAGEDFVRLRIDSVVRLAAGQVALAPEDELRQQLLYLLQQQQLEEWIQQLRQQAVVHYPEQSLKKGEN